MQLEIFNQKMNQVGIIDVFTSLIWTKRYDEPGDFEVVLSLDGDLPDYIAVDNYVALDEDLELGYYMIIETIEIKQDAEDGVVLTISGRSLEAILDRRIVWDKVSYTNKKTEVIIKDLIEKSIVKPTLADRKISDFIYKEPEENVPSSTITNEYDGDSLLDVISSLCSADDNGISIRYLDGGLVYQTYSGTDRSHDQTNVDEVLYSPSLDSLASSQYLESVKTYKNVIQITSNDGSKKYVVGDAAGLDRREKRESSQNVTDQASLNTIKNIILYQNRKTSALEGEAINDVYVYGRDVFVGDVVQFANGYGIEAKARITEYIYSQDLSGINNYPTFTMIEGTTGTN